MEAIRTIVTVEETLQCCSLWLSTDEDEYYGSVQGTGALQREKVNEKEWSRIYNLQKSTGCVTVLRENDTINHFSRVFLDRLGGFM